MAKLSHTTVATRVPPRTLRILKRLAARKGVKLGELLRWALIDYADRRR